MKRLAYFNIDENMTPRSVSDIFAFAARSGFDDVAVFHEKDCDLSSARYREKLMAVFRAAYLHKIRVFLADDSCENSCTGFGQLSSVREKRQRVLVLKSKDEDGDFVLARSKEGTVVAQYPCKDEAFPYGYYPDLTDGECAQMIIDCVYENILREYEKFATYELCGFLCNKPLYKAYDAVPYSSAAMEKFAEKHNREADVFSIVKGNGDFEEYVKILCECMEENFILPLKEFCRANKLEFIVSGTDCSVTEDFCEKEGIVCLSDCVKGAAIVRCETATDVLAAYLKLSRVCVPIAPFMGPAAKLGDFFEKHKGAEFVSLEELKNTDGDAYIICNTTAESITVGLLMDGEWCICDWENGAIYDMDTKKTYNFNPYSFLCIKRKDKDIYTDNLPVRVGQVVIGDWEEDGEIAFVQNEDGVTFSLPADALGGKCVCIEGDWQYLKVKLGYNEYEFLAGGCVLPLYEFLAGAQCTVNIYKGKIDKVVLLKKSSVA
ncbi:MAG: hypothetical protein IJ297_04050 [Clostridia bacterium]|nr:hypothetical protein [Clostridia bacterium]